MSEKCIKYEGIIDVWEGEGEGKGETSINEKRATYLHTQQKLNRFCKFT